MPEMPRTKFNSPWTVAVIEAALNDVSSAKGSSESLTAALNAMRAEINSLSGGVHLKGAVDYYNDLPASPSEGDAYTVRYQGASGTDPLGIEYAWATYQGTPQWIPIGVDPSVFAKQTEMDVVANAGAKNLLEIIATSKTKNGLNFSINSDGSVSIDGTATSSTTFSLNDQIGLPHGQYILSGTVPRNVYLTARSTSGTNYIVTNRNAEIEIDADINYVYINIASGTTLSNAVIKPMLRPAAITDSTFQPYALPNPTLTPAAIKAVDEGAKNLIQNNCHSKNVHGVTATTNADGSITISGASDYANNFLIMYDLYAGDNATSSFDSHLTLEPGTYINKGTGRSDVKLQIVEYNTSSDYSTVSDGDTDTTFTLTKSYFVARLWISKDANFSTPVTVYPMICTAADWAVSQKFVPYAPSNRELYEMILALQNGA